MKNLLKKIRTYTEYLNNISGLSISFHFSRDIFNRMSADTAGFFLDFNNHTNPYCIAVKKSCHPDCLSNQKSILEKCRSSGPFFNICHAGVYEYIHPIYHNGDAVGFVASSGYRTTTADIPGIINHSLWESSLNCNVPADTLDALIPPLCFMAEELLQAGPYNTENEYSSILQFLNEYHTSISLAELAGHFNRSTSHISHLFKRESGTTLRAYCNNLKLLDAKKLLLNTDISITQIAMDVGFNDTSYFIYLFKKKFGVSPLHYRRENLLPDKKI